MGRCLRLQQQQQQMMRVRNKIRTKPAPPTTRMKKYKPSRPHWRTWYLPQVKFPPGPSIEPHGLPKHVRPIKGGQEATKRVRLVNRRDQDPVSHRKKAGKSIEKVARGHEKEFEPLLPCGQIQPREFSDSYLTSNCLCCCQHHWRTKRK